MTIVMNRDALFSIALHLPPKELRNFFLVSKLTNTINSPHFWSLKLQKDYAHVVVDPKDALSLYRRYSRFKTCESVRTIIINGNCEYYCDDQLNYFFLNQVLQENPRRGDHIIIENMICSLSIWIGRHHLHRLFDGKRIVAKCDLDGVINEDFPVIEEFALDCWDYDTLFHINLKPYYDQVIEHESQLHTGHYQSWFISWNNLKYTLQYPHRGVLQRESSLWCHGGSSLICY